MDHVFASLAWLSAHPAQTAIIVAMVLAVSYLIACVVGVVLAAHEDLRRERERQTFDRIMQANMQRDWPAPKSPKGGDWRQRRTS